MTQVAHRSSGSFGNIRAAITGTIVPSTASMFHATSPNSNTASTDDTIRPPYPASPSEPHNALNWLRLHNQETRQAMATSSFLLSLCRRSPVVDPFHEKHLNEIVVADDRTEGLESAVRHQHQEHNEARRKPDEEGRPDYVS